MSRRRYRFLTDPRFFSFFYREKDESCRVLRHFFLLYYGF